MTWRRSSKCAAGECVEVLLGDKVHVRDSKDGTEGPRLVFDADTWRRFVDALKGGDMGGD